MRNIRTIEGALNLFEKNAIIQGEAIISGNYKICNKTHDIITKCINFLKKKNKMDLLLPYLEHKDVSVRYIAASALLPLYTKESKKTLKWIRKKDKSIIGLNAEITLDEWRKEKWMKIIKKLWPKPCVL
ncbi:hypothetical protein [Xylanibacter rarus]|jgi:hypothetical protein|uniref:hypothetical protein n=1 Tax=Xylanibacter rarus TaxID=1676614 RepID=UPI003520816A